MPIIGRLTVNIITVLQIISPDMASKVLVDPSELRCSVCLDVFMDPRVLPCVHTYCYGCLEGLVNKSGSTQTITCPLCGDVSPIPSGELKKIKDNSFIAGLVARKHNMDVKSEDGEFKSTKENLPFSDEPYFDYEIYPMNIIIIIIFVMIFIFSD